MALAFSGHHYYNGNMERGAIMEKLEKLEYLWKDRRRRLGMPLSFNRYRLSSDRLFNVRGLLTTTEDEILLYRVQDLTVRISLGQRIFGTGTVLVKSSDPTQPLLELKNIRRPREVKELLHRQVEKMKDVRGVRASELVGPGGHGPGRPGHPDELDGHEGHGHQEVDLDGDGVPDALVCDEPPAKP